MLTNGVVLGAFLLGWLSLALVVFGVMILFAGSPLVGVFLFIGAAVLGYAAYRLFQPVR